LRDQSAQPWEIVVSDDSDPEHVGETRAVAEKFGAKYCAGPRRGLYANRNAAALACTGTHIRTMDDDHTFPERHFANCLAAIAEDPRAFWTTGEAGYIDGQYFGMCETAFQLGPAGVGYRVADPDNNWAISDGSTIYPSEVFKRGYRMEDMFSYGSSYLEFGAFLYSRGFRGRSIAGVYVCHYARKEDVDRAQDFLTRRSRLFASMCFNLYFQRNLPLAIRHCLSFVAGCGLREASAVKRIWKRAHERWCNLS
jgi:glycosyltransferase involved in cell wall biosynthesis